MKSWLDLLDVFTVEFSKMDFCMENYIFCEVDLLKTDIDRIR